MPFDGQKIGLDIGQSHITLIRLVSRVDDNGETVIEPLLVAECGLPRGTFDNAGLLVRPEIVTQAIKTLRRQHKIKTKATVLSLSGSALSIQPVTRPNHVVAEGHDALMSSIRIQLEPGLPYRDNAHISYEVLRSGEGEGAMTELLTVAVPRAVPTVLARAVNAAGLRVEDVLPEPCVLPRAIQVGASSVEMVLAIGMLSSSVMLVRNGLVHYAQSMPFGADHFTQALVAGGMDAPAAERWKRTHSLIAPQGGTDPYADQRASMRATADNFSEALFQLLTYASSESSGGVSRLLLCGGGANLSGLRSHLNMNLGIPVELAEPAAGLHVTDPAAFPRHALAYALAMHASTDPDEKETR